MFYYRVNEYGGVHNKEPIGVLLIEMCRVQREDDSALPFAFSICMPLFIGRNHHLICYQSIGFDSDLDKKHFMGCSNQKQCDEWIQILSQCSYQNQRNRLIDLRNTIMDITGTDPLASYSYQTN